MRERRSDPVARAVRKCERYWRQAGVPRARAADMRGELERHLRDAQAAGKPVTMVIGEDPIAFADAWAMEWDPALAGRRIRRAPGPAVVSFLVGMWAALVILVEPVRITTTAGGPGGSVRTESHLDAGGVMAVSLLAMVAVLCLAAGLMLLRRRGAVPCILLTAAVPIAFFVQVPASALAAAALAWCLLLELTDRSRHKTPVGASPL